MLQTRQKSWYIKPLIIFITLVLMIGLFQGPARAADIEQPNIDEVKLWLNMLFVEQIDWEQVDTTSVDSIIKSLGDKYTVYMTPKDFEHLTTSLGGEFGGIGVYIQQVEGYVTVTSPMTDSPAEKAGLQTEDKIIKVDGNDVVDTPLNQVVELIKGEPGTDVELTILRGDEELEFTLTREEIRVHSVAGEMLDDEMGYLRVHSFGENTKNELEAEMARLDEAGALGYIIDLRNNGGGYLNSALEIADMLIDPGAIVHVTRRGKTVQTYGTATKGIGKPLVVLVNKGSASASEILAAAIQQTGGGILVGTDTFGKASVQRIVSLSNGGNLKLTTAHYLTPNRTNINGVGLKPIFYVEDMKKQLDKAKEILKVAIEQERVKESEPDIRLFIGRTTGMVGDKAVALDSKPFIEEGRTYVPVRFISEALGMNVTWDKSKGAVITGKDTKISLAAGADSAMVNGEQKAVQEPLIIKEGRSYLPVRAFVNLLGGTVDWNAEAKEIDLFFAR